jgi:hypothetical protein
LNKYLPYPYYQGEKHQVTSYLYLKIEKQHKWMLFNEVFSIIEYQPDGLSRNLFKQYLSSPNSYADYRIERMKSAYNFEDKFKNAIHYVSSSLIARKKIFLKETPFKLIILLALPIGFILYIYLKKTKRKSLIK